MAERQESVTPVGTSGTRLPEYANPPLQEVALAVQFAPLLEFRTPHMGLLWRELRSRFPRVLDLGHEWAVRGFASIISAELQKLWGRDDGR